MAEAGPGSRGLALDTLSGSSGWLPLASSHSQPHIVSELSPKEDCPPPCFIFVLVKVKRSFYSKPIYPYNIIAKGNNSKPEAHLA